jgi:hypothetical protein
METVSAITEETSAAAEETSASTEEMNAQVEEVVASAQSLADMANALEKAVELFKVSASDTATAARGDGGSSANTSPDTQHGADSGELETDEQAA